MPRAFDDQVTGQDIPFLDGGTQTMPPIRTAQEPPGLKEDRSRRRTKEAEPTIFRRPEGLIEPTDADRLRDACQDLSRQAFEAFREACDSPEEDQAEARFAAAKDAVQALWEYTRLRGQAFQDLLALIEAALGRAELATLNPAQRDTLRQAFADLRRWFLDDAQVQEHINRFAEHNVDVLGPLRDATPKKVRITFEEID